MSRTFAFLYGAVAYAAFLGTFLYAIGFVTGFVVPKGINDGPAGSVGLAIAVDIALLGLFGIQHSVMARPVFKRWLTRFVPKAIERSTFVFATCVCFGLLFWFWRPIDTVLWQIEPDWARAVVWSVAGLGWLIVLYSTWLIDHFDLFGLRQVVLHFKNRDYIEHPFVERSLYRAVRHPLMLGFLIAFWVIPTMTGGQLLFAIVTTAYILVALQFEERDLVKHLGQDYVDYKKRTPMLLPIPRKHPDPAPLHVEPAGSPITR